MTAPDGGDRRNRTVALACAGVFVAMVGLSFASVPLYDLFCKVTGYEGTTQVATSAEGVKVLDRDVTVRFDANVAPGLKWHFEPEVHSVTLKVGELGTVKFRAKNLTDVATTGRATYNVTPDAMGAYFSKIACFCFTEETLQPGEELEMGVTFYVDPAMVDDPDSASIRTVTLSYTFFPAATPARPVAAVEPDAAAKRL
ncbi:cytochrome c oxidase assembly protein [Oharaeibacter diazotrophicus]|uniref:Cytochrome c oxidase assembly protein CtaG n=1 Tax=Oharaeibacter diazotrophicus TaxID=1920512 RepID=A0A4R6RBK0_9HYPH|nr:cytochrome c oxidase assembly protein [Oharaeibacter diazotrophicus]TDP83414.1 cytochrome c oxidase assembly protein subunit 11 [Oharaeibacter diazotrophicus]BBE72247.1 cytochrome c oxidase assembly protein CtaG [Pleomorphomonas sp. SM30]GLS79015.1 cytochrome c oxidase assembly protein CtaG [Oharaeibacter diazotrophicus]